MMRVVPTLLLLVGCLEPQLVICGDGRACPIGTTCQLALETCITDEQTAACADAGEGDTCQLESGPGTCVQGACFEQRCGDRIVEQGEACDDGNFISGDGCSADCRSDEECGDGIFEPEIGEACEDGNVASGDGCSSLCEKETIRWRVRTCGAPVATSYTIATQSTAFDVNRNVLVRFDSNWLWEWDGTGWSCSELPERLDGALRYTYGLVYDPVRGRILSFETDAVYAWDGTTWTTLGPGLYWTPSTVAYDSLRDEIVAYSSISPQSVHIWNPVTYEWSEVAVQSVDRPEEYYAASAYNPATDELVMVTSGFGTTTPAETWVWKRGLATWIKRSQTWSPYRGVALAYHPTLGIVAFGGYDDSYRSELYRWNGATWDIEATTTELFVPRELAALVYDPSTSSLLVTGGVGLGTADVLRFANGGWTQWQPVGRIGLGVSAVVTATKERTLLGVDPYGATWRLEGENWTEVVTATPAPPTIVYRPDLQRVTGYSNGSGIYEWDGSDWVLVSTAVRAPLPQSLAWDPTRGLVMYDEDGAHVHTASGWQKFADPIPMNFGGRLAFDHNANHLTLTTKHVILNETTAFALVGDSWERLFTFTNASEFTLRELSGRGTVLFLTPDAHDAWEYVDDSWRRHAGPRLGTQTHASASDLITGEVLLFAYDTRLTLAVGYGNGEPRDSCIDGEDLDGDGASGCADDDCWWRCEPTCPPASSCFSD